MVYPGMYCTIKALLDDRKVAKRFDAMIVIFGYKGLRGGERDGGERDGGERVAP